MNRWECSNSRGGGLDTTVQLLLDLFPHAITPGLDHHGAAHRFLHAEAQARLSMERTILAFCWGSAEGRMKDLSILILLIRSSDRCCMLE